MRRARGASQCRYSRRFGYNSVDRRDTPVAFLPGRAMLAARPADTGAPDRNTIGIVLVASDTARGRRADRHDEIHFHVHQLGH